jgi:hypothetical protein
MLYMHDFDLNDACSLCMQSDGPVHVQVGDSTVDLNLLVSLRQPDFISWAFPYYSVFILFSSTFSTNSVSVSRPIITIKAYCQSMKR